MDKDKILDYVMKSPQNTNRAVLDSLLDGAGNEELRVDIQREGEYGSLTYSITEESKSIIDQAKAAYDSTTLNIMAYLDTRLIGILKTSYGDYGSPNGLYAERTNLGANNTYSVDCFKINTTDYSVTCYSFSRELTS